MVTIACWSSAYSNPSSRAQALFPRRVLMAPAFTFERETLFSKTAGQVTFAPRSLEIDSGLALSLRSHCRAPSLALPTLYASSLNAAQSLQTAPCDASRTTPYQVSRRECIVQRCTRWLTSNLRPGESWAEKLGGFFNHFDGRSALC